MFSRSGALCLVEAAEKLPLSGEKRQRFIKGSGYFINIGQRKSNVNIIFKKILNKIF